MDLEFSDDETELGNNARDVLAGIAPPSVVRAIYEGKGDDGGVWQKMVELGWPALAIPEAHDGLGMTFLDLAIVVEQIGRATAPGPFLATATQFAPTVVELGSDEAKARILPTVAAGEMTGALAVAEDGRWNPAAVQATASPSGADWVLSGRKDAVLHGASADEVLVIARGADGLGVFLVPRASVKAEEWDVVDPTMPIADVSLDGVTVGPDRVVAVPAPTVEASLRRALEEATVAMAVATVGTCRRIFETTLAYAKDREQYSRPIGSFQALKHRFADMYLSVERAAALGWFAALTIAEEDPRRHEATSVAKAAAGECQRLLVREGLQLHGGIGFTWEHDLHFLLKRAKTGDALFGNAVAHRAELAEMLGLVNDSSKETAA